MDLWRHVRREARYSGTEPWQECALCHGNILWVPRHVVDRIGILDGFYLHALGDYDYSRDGAFLRNTVAGCPIFPRNLCMA